MSSRFWGSLTLNYRLYCVSWTYDSRLSNDGRLFQYFIPGFGMFMSNGFRLTDDGNFLPYTYTQYTDSYSFRVFSLCWLVLIACCLV